MSLPSLTPQAVHYAWHQLIQRAGFTPPEAGNTGSIKLHYHTPNLVQPGGHGIIVVPCRSEALQTLLTRCDHSLLWLPVERLVPEATQLPFSDPVPVLFWGEGCEDGSKPFVERRDNGTIIFYADILAATFFMLSRWEETVIPTRDQHGRFPATASVAYRQGFLDRPIVDEYALILQAWLKTLLPGWTPQPAQFSVKLSHDIDHVRRFPSLYRAGRTLAGDLLKRHSPDRAIHTLQALRVQTLTPEQDPFLQGIYDLAELSEQCGLNSAFYFMAAEPGPFDTGYDPAAPVVRRCIDTLRHREHEVGFHPGYRTLDDPERFAAEKARVDPVLDRQAYGGRQHYLRFRTPDTWRQWEQAGLTYDSTLSYADHEGFRCGTCHPYQPFDVEQDRQLDLLEIPLIVMDGTLHQYRSLTPEQGEDKILTLAQRCKQVNGVFTLLWHNTSLQDKWEPWAAMYRRVLPRLAEMADQTASLPDPA